MTGMLQDKERFQDVTVIFRGFVRLTFRACRACRRCCLQARDACAESSTSLRTAALAAPRQRGWSSALDVAAENGWTPATVRLPHR